MSNEYEWKTKMRFFCVQFNQPLFASKKKILSFVFMFRDFNTHIDERQGLLK